MIHKTILFAGAALIALPTAAFAQANAQPGAQAPASNAPAGSTASTTATAGASAGAKVTQGAAVSDTKGGSVGTIDSVDGEFAVLNTGTNKVRLPIGSFGAGPNGPIIAMTKAEVDQAAGGAAQADKAALTAMLTKGAKVSDPQGGSVGTIEANDGQFITVATAKNKVKLPVSAFGKGTSGVVISMTAAQLDAAAGASAPAASGSAAGSASGGGR